MNSSVRWFCFPKEVLVKRLSISVIAVVMILAGALSPALSGELAGIRDAITEKNLDWTAGRTSVSGLSIDEKKALCGTEIRFDLEESKSTIPIPGGTDLPAYFDWRDNEGNWVTPIRDQASCGSCWAFSVVGAFEAVIKIAVGDPGFDPDLSEQGLVSDCYPGADCSGSMGMWGPQSFLHDSGTVDEACYPYVAHNTPCEPCGGYANRIVQTDRWGWVCYFIENINKMKQALYHYGPLSTTFTVFSDFSYYTGGVYKYSGGTLLGGHAVVIVGWNDEERCWIVKNSWGEYWGENGYFRFSWDDWICMFGSNTSAVIFTP